MVMILLNQDHSYIALFVCLFELVTQRNGKFEMALDQNLSIPENVLFTLVHKKIISLYWKQSSYNFAIFDTAFLILLQDIDDNAGW